MSYLISPNWKLPIKDMKIKWGGPFERFFSTLRRPNEGINGGFLEGKTGFLVRYYP